MRIAFFGSSLLSTYWNGAATYYRGLLKALARRGHHITFYEPDAFDRQRHRDMEPPDWAEVVVYAADEAAAQRCLQEARRADVVVKASGVGVLDELLQEGVLEARRPGALAVLWDVDAAATLDLLHATPDDPLRPLIPAYDLVLTYGGGRPVTGAYLGFGARRCEAVYNALDSETHHPAPPDPRFGCNLALLANRLPDRERRVEEFFLKPATLLPGRRFLLGGSGWDDKPTPPNVVRIGHVGSADHNALNCSARAVLNVARDSMARNGFSPATRVFEAAGAGACLITDAWEGLEEFLEPGREVLAAADGDEVAALLDALTSERARAIGEAARRRVLAEHTYDLRAAQVESLLVGAARGQARPRAIA
jgi:spore maturation protein CgeB